MTLLCFKLGNESADVVSFFVLLECGILYIKILLNHGTIKFFCLLMRKTEVENEDKQRIIYMLVYTVPKTI